MLVRRLVKKTGGAVRPAEEVTIAIRTCPYVQCQMVWKV